MSWVMVCRGDALGGMDDDGKYLVSFDPDAGDGIGEVLWGDMLHARRFDDPRDVVMLWNTASTLRPVRDDGLPNKPLTAWSVEPMRVEP